MKFMAEEEIKAENQVSLTPDTDGRCLKKEKTAITNILSYNKEVVS